MAEEKKCPYCAELVKSEAVVCKHCGKHLDPKLAYANVPVSKRIAKGLNMAIFGGCIAAVLIAALMAACIKMSGS